MTQEQSSESKRTSPGASLGCKACGPLRGEAGMIRAIKRSAGVVATRFKIEARWSSGGKAEGSDARAF